jgi:hypothetical protein
MRYAGSMLPAIATALLKQVLLNQPTPLSNRGLRHHP